MKKYLLYGLIISLVITGLLGIGALLSDQFDELHIRILVTTLAFTVYSIIGLCCNSTLDGKYVVFGRFGLGITFIGLLYAVVTTWITPKAEEFLQLRFSLLVIAFCFAHCSLMLLVKTHNLAISVVRMISISTSVMATLIAVGMLSSLEANEGTFKLLGIVSIIGVITTIVAPILAFTANKSNRTNNENAAGV